MALHYIKDTVLLLSLLLMAITGIDSTLTCPDGSDPVTVDVSDIKVLVQQPPSDPIDCFPRPTDPGPVDISEQFYESPVRLGPRPPPRRPSPRAAPIRRSKRAAPQEISGCPASEGPVISNPGGSQPNQGQCCTTKPVWIGHSPGDPLIVNGRFYINPHMTLSIVTCQSNGCGQVCKKRYSSISTVASEWRSNRWNPYRFVNFFIPTSCYCPTT